MPVKAKRDSLDRRLAKLTPDERMVLLMYGEAGPGGAAEQLARHARAVRGIAKALKLKAGQVSEGYEASFNELRGHVADFCTAALLDNDTAFFRQLVAAMRKVNSEVAGWPISHHIRFLLLNEAKAGPVNLSQFAARLKRFRGLSQDVRSLSRIAHKLGIPTAPKGRPRKQGK